MPDFFYQCIIPTTHVVLDIRFAAGEEDDPTGLVVPVLAAEVEGGKAAPVLDVEVGPVPAEQPHRLAKPLPGRLVQGRVPVLQLGEIFFKYRFEPVTPRAWSTVDNKNSAISYIVCEIVCQILCGNPDVW